MPPLRTILFWACLAALLYWIVQNPAQAGLLVHNFIQFLSKAFHSLTVLVSSAMPSS
jgi:hypothetical protein